MKKILLIIGLALLVPFYARAAEPGCGGGANRIEKLGTASTDSWRLKTSVSIQFENWENPGQDEITYYSTSFAHTLNDDFLRVSRITARVYNRAVNSEKSCNDCSSIAASVTLPAGQNRPWLANSVHTATHNGVTLRDTTLSLSR